MDFMYLVVLLMHIYSTSPHFNDDHNFLNRLKKIICLLLVSCLKNRICIYIGRSVRKKMDVNEQGRQSNFTLRHKLK
jgi:hypothetical protein